MSADTYRCLLFPNPPFPTPKPFDPFPRPSPEIVLPLTVGRPLDPAGWAIPREEREKEFTGEKDGAILDFATGFYLSRYREDSGRGSAGRGDG